MNAKKLFGLVLLLNALPTLAGAQPPALAPLDAEIPALMEAWRVPGLALAVLRDGEVIFSRGYGVRAVGRDEAVDADTLFAIGSITKSFTAACLGLLVEDGVLGWDDPVTDHLPHFALKDPWISRQVTIRDFLSHRTGVEPNNLIYWGTSLGRDEIVRRMRFLDIRGFRSSFQYNNLAYLAAGQIVPAAIGRSWDDCVRERIFAPLDMERSTVNNRDFAGDGNVASAHADLGGEIRTVPRLDLDNDAPAGSIYSSANEMARWILAHVQDGTVNGRTVLPSAVVREMRTPQNLVTDPELTRSTPGAHMVAYGFGWNLQDYRGELAVAHGGGTLGMTAQVGMIPSRGFGCVVLTNARFSQLPALIQYKVYDALLGVEDSSWDFHFEALKRESEAWMASFVPPQPIEGTRPSLPLEAYVGTYINDFYGPAVVRLEEGQLTLELTDLGLEATLTHRHFDTFDASWEPGKRGMFGAMVPSIGFELSLDGKIESLTPGSSRFRRVEQGASTAPGGAGES